jgi:iron complex outermembrane receptor protein
LDVRGSFDGLSSVIDSLNVRFGVNDYEHVELEGDAVGTRFTNDATELRVELLHRAAGRWSGAFGIQAGERKFIAIGEEAFVPPVDGESLGVFLVEDVDLMPWQLSLGGRVESGAYRPSNGAPRFDDTASSFSLGAVRSFGDGYAFMATLARSERLPVAEELYSNGPHVATGVVQIGDPTLVGETAQHVDVGLRGRMGPLNWTVTTFHTQYDDFIYLADSGAADPVEGLPIFVYAQADADFSGVEAEVFLPLLAEGSNEVDMRLYADYVRGELTSGEPLPRLPPLRYGARLEYHNSRLLVGLEGTRYDDQDDVAAFEEETAGYFMLNADLRWRFVGVTGAELEMFVKATNLYDEEARKHTSFVKDVAPLPGRNYSLGFRSRF